MCGKRRRDWGEIVRAGAGHAPRRACHVGAQHVAPLLGPFEGQAHGLRSEPSTPARAAIAFRSRAPARAAAGSTNPEDRHQLLQIFAFARRAHRAARLGDERFEAPAAFAALVFEQGHRNLCGARPAPPRGRGRRSHRFTGGRKDTSGARSLESGVGARRLGTWDGARRSESPKVRVWPKAEGQGPGAQGPGPRAQVPGTMC